MSMKYVLVILAVINMGFALAYNNWFALSGWGSTLLVTLALINQPK
jgi:hypothetical protein